MIRAFNLMTDKIEGYHRTLQEDISRARLRITNTERRLFAAQRLSTAGTLAAGIAHEINNPLGGMVNAVRALKEGRLDGAKREEYLNLVLDGLDRVKTIVQKILQLRPRPFQAQPVHLRDAVDRAIAFIEHRARAKEVAIHNELPPDLPRVNGDPVELQQAFLNVLMNAVDACVVGEGVITVYHRGTAESVSVSVADNGCGMDEEEAARCMDPFFTTKDVGEGTGLGLAVAHNIVSNHGGKVEVRSERGRGSTFTLTFPVFKDPAPPASGASAPG
jgi:signal transduction histidine kinase